MRVYVAPVGLWLTLDAGKFQTLEFRPRTGQVRLGLMPATESTPTARLRIEQPARLDGVGSYQPATRVKTEREAFVVALSRHTTWVTLIPRHEAVR